MSFRILTCPNWDPDSHPPEVPELLHVKVTPKKTAPLFLIWKGSPKDVHRQQHVWPAKRWTAFVSNQSLTGPSIGAITITFSRILVRSRDLETYLCLVPLQTIRLKVHPISQDPSFAETRTSQIFTTNTLHRTMFRQLKAHNSQRLSFLKQRLLLELPELVERLDWIVSAKWTWMILENVRLRKMERVAVMMMVTNVTLLVTQVTPLPPLTMTTNFTTLSTITLTLLHSQEAHVTSWSTWLVTLVLLKRRESISDDNDDNAFQCGWHHERIKKLS